MDVQGLRWFVVVAELEHMTRAAEAVGITQPALSKAMARLEREVGLPLLDRRGRTVRLNRQGRLFRDGAARALSELDAARRHLADLVGPETGTVPVGFLPTLATWLLPELVRGFRSSHPKVRFVLHQDNADRLLPALRDGTVDLILTTQRPQTAGARWRRVYVEALHLVTPPGHPLAGTGPRRAVPLAAAAGEPFVMLRAGLGLRELTDLLCREAGFVPTVAFEGEAVETVRSLVGAGLGVALLPEAHRLGEEGGGPPAVRHAGSLGGRTGGPSAESRQSTVDLRVSTPRCEREIGLVWNVDRYRSPAVEAFRSHVLARVREGGRSGSA